LSPQYSPLPPKPCSSHTTSQDSVPIWFPHWPAWMCKISREEARSLEAGSKSSPVTRGRKRAGRSGIDVMKSVWKFYTGNRKCRWRARVYPERKKKLDYHTSLWSCGRRAKRAGCGRMQSRSTCVGHVLSAVRQGRQRRDAVAAGGEQLGRSTAERIYPSQRCHLGEIKSLADSFATGAPPPSYF
jgi:hypothetical protein